MPAMCRAFATALVLSAAAAGLGCRGGVQRTIHITSEPQGALVHLNDEEVGRTPLSVPFTFYGTYDVRLEADGYQPLWTMAKTDKPWWDNLGPDLFASAVPGAKSDVRWHFDLRPVGSAGDVDADALLERAQTLRHRVVATEPEAGTPEGE